MEQEESHTSNSPQLVHSGPYILLILEEYESTGFSVKDYCEINHINEKVISSWLEMREIEKNKKNNSVFTGFNSETFLSGQKLFAEVSKVKLYKEVSIEYLKEILT